ncbi:MAG: dUTP diphosphatase [Candidatus Pararuminococcus gallinarum]|jgi:dUTP pyrophosphatase
MQSLRIKKLEEGAKIPFRATLHSAGIDLYALLKEPVEIGSHEICQIHTGIACEIPIGFAGFVFARSSLGIKHGVTPANCVGVIDSDYRGEIIVGLINQLDTPFIVQPGDRIAQLIIMPVMTPDIEEVEELTPTRRGTGGFGSTGK